MYPVVQSLLLPALVELVEQHPVVAMLATRGATAGGSRFIHVNPAWCTMYGYALQEVIGLPTITVAGDLQATDLFAVARVKQALEVGDIGHLVTMHHRKDKEPFWVEGIVMPLAVSEGPLPYIIAFRRELSERPALIGYMNKKGDTSWCQRDVLEKRIKEMALPLILPEF